ncbi:MAG: hypothetical protein KME03_00975 [Aphanocapsa lilacina HA4352-LM1]|jgi:hypothetical protein|nr:hypothetical protein [Aphanocapsa lilacina HA4352-LM1]
MPQPAALGANFVDWRERNRVFSHLSLLRGYPRNYVSARAPERLRAGLVSPALMELARIRPLIGRPFSQEEEIEGKNQVVVLSERELLAPPLRRQPGSARQADEARRQKSHHCGRHARSLRICGDAQPDGGHLDSLGDQKC